MGFTWVQTFSICKFFKYSKKTKDSDVGMFFKNKYLYLLWFANYTEYMRCEIIFGKMRDWSASSI